MQDVGTFQKSQTNKHSGITLEKRQTNQMEISNSGSFGWICNGIFWGFLLRSLSRHDHLCQETIYDRKQVCRQRQPQVNKYTRFFRSIDLLTAFVRFCYLHVGCMVWHSSKKPSPHEHGSFVFSASWSQRITPEMNSSNVTSQQRCITYCWANNNNSLPWNKMKSGHFG